MTNLEQLERDVAHVVRRGDELDVERVALELDARRDDARVVVLRDARGLVRRVAERRACLLYTSPSPRDS